MIKLILRCHNICAIFHKGTFTKLNKTFWGWGGGQIASGTPSMVFVDIGVVVVGSSQSKQRAVKCSRPFSVCHLRLLLLLFCLNVDPSFDRDKISLVLF